MTIKQPKLLDNSLIKHYRLLLFAITLPLFIVVLVLAVSQYRDQRSQVLHDFAQNSAAYVIALQNVAKLANDHVLQMQSWSETYLSNPPSRPSDLRAYFKPRIHNGELDSFTLDAVPNGLQSRIGQLFWLNGDPRQPEIGRGVLDHALEFFNLVRLTHQVTPYFQWSYFFPASRDYFNMYPWAHSEEVLAHLGSSRMRSGIDKYYDYEFYTAGTPQRNVRRQPYWTEPYIDAAGAGAMITHGAPVYVNNQFKGVVATDVKLATLEQFLMALAVDVGRLLIINDQGIVLADSFGSPLNAMRKVEGALIEEPKINTIVDALNGSDNEVNTADNLLVFRRIQYAPWTLIHSISSSEIVDLLLPRFLPYGVILVFLIVTFFIALYLLRKEFIQPSLSLAGYIQRLSQDPFSKRPTLPVLWQPFVNLVCNTFASHIAATQQLRERDTRLQQILNNSSAVIYVCDLDQKFILVNRCFEVVTGRSKENIVGKRQDEVFPAQTAAAFRANDQKVIKEKKALEFEEQVTVSDGVHTYISIKFPLYDTAGNIIAICGISTDITNRKHTEEIIRQAALGISQAQGEGVFSSLVTHLAHAIDTDYALIGVLDSHDTIRTRALYAHREIRENITYSLAGSPCENVVGQQFRFYPNRIQQQFPQDTLLQEIGVESYAAIPLFDTSGHVLGLLAVLDSKELQEEKLVESILQIFAGRAASELERESTDAALRASEASYRAIFEASEDAIFVHDLDTGAILDVNHKACEIYGYTQEEMRHIDIGTLSSGVSPYTQEDAIQLLQKAIDGERLHFEWHRKNRDGSLHWDEVSVRKASIGGQDRLLAFTREITARKKAEQKLRASEEQYRAIFNASSDALMLWDSEGHMVDSNRTTWLLGGYTQEEFMAIPLSDHIHPSSQAAFELFSQALTHGQPFATEGKVIRKDGVIMELEVRGAPMLYKGKTHMLTVARDITAQKRANEELARQREALRQNEKLSAMGALVANVAHELNNPLAILMGRAVLLENKLQNSAIASEASKIRTAAERCGRIVRTFLAMARQRPSEHRMASLNDIVSGALDLLGYGLRTSGIVVHTTLADNLPQQSMDSDQIGQVLVNLLVNAQYALSEQHSKRCIEIETGVENLNLYLRVKDNGFGIAPDIRDRIFDPFFTTKPEGMGTGVGLSVSRAIMREHQGDLVLENTDFKKNNQGASFKLWLTLNKQSTGDAADNANQFLDTLHEGHTLILDDELEVANLLADILKSAGFTVTVATTGQEALAWLEQNSCDFILSDIRMPGLDGPSLWRKLKQKHPALAKRMAFVTGDTLSASIAPFLNETGLPCLEKPFTPEQVLELVARIEAPYT